LVGIHPSDQFQESLVADFLTNMVHQDVVLNSIEEFRKVHVDTPSVSTSNDLLHLLYSTLG